MDYEELITQLNLDLDNKESQEEAKRLKAKLHKKSFILLLLSSILIGLSLIAFIALLILGLRSLNATILFSIIPFVIMVISIFGLFFGVSYRALAKSIIIAEKMDHPFIFWAIEYSIELESSLSIFPTISTSSRYSSTKGISNNSSFLLLYKDKYI